MIRSEDLDKKFNLEAAHRFISSGVNEILRMSSVLRAEDGWINPCDPKFIKLLKLPRSIEYIHFGDSLTSVSGMYYKTTSLWYLVLACSGYLHPHQIPRNTSIFLPTRMNVLTALEEQPETNVGKTIII